MGRHGASDGRWQRRTLSIVVALAIALVIGVVSAGYRADTSEQRELAANALAVSEIGMQSSDVGTALKVRTDTSVLLDWDGQLYLRPRPELVEGAGEYLAIRPIAGTLTAVITESSMQMLNRWDTVRSGTDVRGGGFAPTSEVPPEWVPLKLVAYIGGPSWDASDLLARGYSTYTTTQGEYISARSQWVYDEYLHIAHYRLGTIFMVRSYESRGLFDWFVAVGGVALVSGGVLWEYGTNLKPAPGRVLSPDTWSAGYEVGLL